MRGSDGGAARPSPPRWMMRGRELTLDRPRIMGILNVTPDSFSDGGDFFSANDAVARGDQLFAEGADLIDVGGESTRPNGARPVDAAEEIRRVVPVLGELRSRHPTALLSVDTVKADVAAAALGAGADVVNDVSGFRLDIRMGAVCADAGAGVILMHSRGGVSDMASYQHAVYGTDVIDDVLSELEASVAAALRAGIARDAIAVDPGFGFSKRTEHSLAVLRGLDRVRAIGFPVVVGMSRKRFVGELAGVREARERLHASIGANVAALMRGARVFRVHDVAATRQALDVAWAALEPFGSER